MFKEIYKILSINHSLENDCHTLSIDSRGYETILDMKHSITGDMRNIIRVLDNKWIDTSYYFDSLFNAVCFFKINPTLINKGVAVIICGKIFTENFIPKIKEVKTLNHVFCFSNDPLGKILTIKYILALNCETYSVSILENDTFLIKYDKSKNTFPNQKIPLYMILKRLKFDNFNYRVILPNEHIKEFKNLFDYI